MHRIRVELKEPKMSEKPLPELKSLEEFLFEAPPYEKFSVSERLFESIYGIGPQKPPVDGHCPYCNRASTFEVSRVYIARDSEKANISSRTSFDERLGVGSFVYLRRVFERLITTRFEEFKASEGWSDDQFYAVRMEDKIDLLKDHLPSFLVENRKIYSILSVGVHELDEKECLNWFEVMKQSIIIILEDDKKKKEELSRREVFAQAIKGFGTDPDMGA